MEKLSVAIRRATARENAPNGTASGISIASTFRSHNLFCCSSSLFNNYLGSVE
jgi:hypothetical protein